MIKSILGFLFGKMPKIFNSQGAVQHDLGKQKWQAWEEKQISDPSYDWKHHSGKNYKGTSSGKGH